MKVRDLTSTSGLHDEVLTSIHPYIAGKKVLDIGCVEHSIDQIDKERNWVHQFLSIHAEQVTGIDILENEINYLQNLGYNVTCQNAETFHFDELFDVIFAGELIEHLSNPGLFLDRCAKHLDINSRLILTTPNTFCAKRLGAMLLKLTNDPAVHPQHTAWYSPSVLNELLSRYRFQVEMIYYVNYPYFKPTLKYRLSYLLSKIIGRHFKDTIVLIAKRTD